MNLVTLEAVGKTFGERVLFADVSLRVMAGERWALVGPNGAGKTTLLEVIAGRLTPDAGQVRFAKGVSVGYLKQEAIEIMIEEKAGKRWEEQHSGDGEDDDGENHEPQ